jgi:hypothetical protein
MLPILHKPKINYDPSTFVTEIPNALSVDQINRLQDYANNTPGLHRRGSKDKNTFATFSTCLVHALHDEIYPLLDPLWEPYKQNILFIEPYEIKLYVEGDRFDYHTDVYVNLKEQVSRKFNLIIQLSDSDEYEGGDLMVGDKVCSRGQGTAILFPACLLHCVTQITKGNRYSLIGHGWGHHLIWEKV